MRVDLAAQVKSKALTSITYTHSCTLIKVLSSTVSKALKMTADPSVQGTSKFCDMFDKFFDSLNVSSLEAGKRTRNAFKAPYHSASDFRIKVTTTRIYSDDA